MKKIYIILLLFPLLGISQIAQIKDLFPGSTTVGTVTTVNSGNPTNFFDFNGTLLFRAIDATSNGIELWKSDGTSGGTVQVKDINIGTTVSSNSSPSNFTLFGSQVLFTATNGTDQQATELWKTDGTNAGTTLVKDINLSGSGNPQNFTIINPSTMLFSASDGVGGNELWKTDGTAAGTINVIDYPGTTNSITWIENLNGLGILGQIVSTTGREIYKSDGSTAGSGLVLDINSGTSSGAGASAYKWGNTIYFQGITTGSGTELWKTDGTTAGTVLVADIETGTASSSPTRFQGIGNTVYFRATTVANGQELWKTDGTAAGTSLVADINVGTGTSNPDQIAAVSGNLYFFASDNNLNYDFYKYDGLVLTKLADFNALTATITTNYVLLNGKIYFAADSNSDGSRELWMTDGTAAGTVSVASSYSGSINPTGVNFITLSNGKLFFSGALTDGSELFSFDTVVLKNNISNLDALSIYPNPTNGILNIETNLTAKIKYTISDLLGKTIANGDVQNNQINFEAQKGLYLLKLESEGSSIVKKIIKE